MSSVFSNQESVISSQYSFMCGKVRSTYGGFVIRHWRKSRVRKSELARVLHTERLLTTDS
jgi:hypothetical protein